MYVVCTAVYSVPARLCILLACECVGHKHLSVHIDLISSTQTACMNSWNTVPAERTSFIAPIQVQPHA